MLCLQKCAVCTKKACYTQEGPRYNFVCARYREAAGEEEYLVGSFFPQATLLNHILYCERFGGRRTAVRSRYCQSLPLMQKSYDLQLAKRGHLPFVDTCRLSSIWWLLTMDIHTISPLPFYEKTSVSQKVVPSYGFFKSHLSYLKKLLEMHTLHLKLTDV